MRLLKIIIYNIFILLVGLILVQAVFYYAFHYDSNNTYDNFIKKYTHSDLIGHHEYLHHIPELNHEYISERYAKGIRYIYFNSWWDQREFDFKKKKKRIFILGDRQAEGYMRNIKEDPFIYLENELNTQYQENVEVINTAYSSYSTLIHYVNVTKYIYPYQPDHIIIYFDLGSDFGNDALYNFLAIRDEENKIIRIPGLNENSKYYLVGNKIYLENDISLLSKIYSKTFLNFLIEKIFPSEQTDIFFKDKKLSESNNFSADTEITLSVINDLLKFTNKNNIGLTFVLIPAISIIDNKNYKYYQTTLIEYLKENNVHYFDAIKLYDENKSQKYLTFDNYHISPYYHKRIIEEIIKDILEKIA